MSTLNPYPLTKQTLLNMNLRQYTFSLVFTLLSLSACTQALPEKAATAPLLQYESYAALEKTFKNDSDTTYVVNFWATWCKPCVEELPYFETLHNTYADKKVKVILVSLDFKKQIEKKLVPFIEKNNLQSNVVVLVDPDANRWIDAIDPEFSGAIPATKIYRQGKSAFYEKSFASFDELNNIVKPFLNSQQ